MTKEQIQQKIKEILSKDRMFNGAKVTISFIDKKKQGKAKQNENNH